MEVWKIVFYFILEIFHSILASSLFHTEISVPFHSMLYCALVVDSILLLLLLLLLLLDFTPAVIASLKIRKRLILKKLLPLPAPFQHFRFRVRFRFQPLSSKCFPLPLPQKLTASAPSFRYRFHIPVTNYMQFKKFCILVKKKTCQANSVSYLFRSAPHLRLKNLSATLTAT